MHVAFGLAGAALASQTLAGVDPPDIGLEHPVKSVISLIVFFAIAFAPAVLGVRYTPGEWYAGLQKPVWTPPNWVFGPVWTLLYTMIAVSGWLVWRKAGLSGAGVAMGFFVLQLALNAIWSPLFFGLHWPGAALCGIITLWFAILGTAVLFWPVSRLAGVLLIPYLLWVGFASALNWELWRLNS
jgi:tryptophan-rich sensory protein